MRFVDDNHVKKHVGNLSFFPFDKVFRLDYHGSFWSLNVSVQHAVALSEIRIFDFEQDSLAKSEKILQHVDPAVVYLRRNDKQQ